MPLKCFLKGMRPCNNWLTFSALSVLRNGFALSVTKLEFDE